MRVRAARGESRVPREAQAAAQARRRNRGPNAKVELTAAERGDRRRFRCEVCPRRWRSTVHHGSCPFCHHRGVQEVG